MIKCLKLLSHQLVIFADFAIKLQFSEVPKHFPQK